MIHKGISGRLWASVRDLYQGMQSRVMHPGIPHDDFFPILTGAREGSVLSPILFVVAVDDMSDDLMQHPYQDAHHRSKKWQNRASYQGRQRTDHRPPGLRVGQIHIPLLQFVDDAVLLASSPGELQHMIDVVAAFCAKNRLTLNPLPGKTEVVEFLCPPSNTVYTVRAPTPSNPSARATLRVSEGYQYLGW